MRFLILLSLVACSLASPSGVSHGSHGVGHSVGYGGGGGGRLGGYGGYRGPISCPPYHADDGTGRCVEAQVNRNVFIYSAPKLQPTYSKPPYIPRPRVETNVIFVRTPERPYQPDPIVVPSAQQKTLLYVLTRNPHLHQRVVQAPAHAPLQPDVFYVNYNEGDNVDVGGLPLQRVLAHQPTQGGRSVVGNAGGYGGYGTH